MNVRKTGAILALGLACSFCLAAQATVQTIALIPNGEVAAGGLGQLSCQGLNRALSLISILPSKVGHPNYFYAPDPAGLISDPASKFYLVRTLQTIEPTAVSLGQPIYTTYAYTNGAGLVKTLSSSSHASDVDVVAWEPTSLVSIAKQLLSSNGGDPSTVPALAPNDYDSIYIVTINRSGSSAIASFRIDHEGVSNPSSTCPGF